MLFVIAPLYIFLFRQRFASTDASPRERYSVWSMNLALLAIAILMSWLFGFWTYVLLQLVAWMVAGASGIWLFYIQHQFEDAYWERDEQWDYTSAALQGSSYYKLPRVLQWLSGNIGFHHIHHLSPQHPELQPRALSQRRSDFPAGEGHHAVLELEITETPVVGRSHEEAGGIRAPAPAAQAAAQATLSFLAGGYSDFRYSTRSCC